MAIFKFSKSAVANATVSKPSPCYTQSDIDWKDDLTAEQMLRILKEAKNGLLGKVIVEQGQCNDRDFTLYKHVRRVEWHIKYGKSLWYDFVTYKVNKNAVILDKETTDTHDPLSPDSSRKVITKAEFRGIARKTFEAMIHSNKKETK